LNAVFQFDLSQRTTPLSLNKHIPAHPPFFQNYYYYYLN
jgi:hypothetical protein